MYAYLLTRSVVCLPVHPLQPPVRLRTKFKNIRIALETVESVQLCSSVYNSYICAHMRTHEKKRDRLNGNAIASFVFLRAIFNNEKGYIIELNFKSLSLARSLSNRETMLNL